MIKKNIQTQKLWNNVYSWVITAFYNACAYDEVQIMQKWPWINVCNCSWFVAQTNGAYFIQSENVNIEPHMKLFNSSLCDSIIICWMLDMYERSLPFVAIFKYVMKTFARLP